MKIRGSALRPAFAATLFASGVCLALAGPADKRGEGRKGEVKPLPPERVELAPAKPSASPSPSAAAAPAEAPRGRDPREIFARANRLYEGGDYAGAAREYESLLRLGYRSGNVHYNLGNAYLKLDRKGEAILQYRKALLLLPRDQDVRSNLDYALTLVEDRIEPRQKTWLLRRWDGAVEYFTLAEWRTASSASLWVLCSLLAALIYLPAARRVLLRMAGVALAALVLCAAAACSRAYLEGQEQAVILSPEAKVRYGPSGKDVIAFILHEGAAVEVENESGDWYQVSLPDGKAGWVEKGQCGVI